MASWVSMLEMQIFSQIVSKTATPLAIYPNKNYTTVPASNTQAEFPNIYIHLLPLVEQGQDLAGRSINAVLTTVQVDVTTNSSQSDVRNISYEIVDVLKSMRFDIISMPETFKEGDIYRATLRGRRMIGNGDVL